MKTGLIKPRTDLAIKYIHLIIDGKEYRIDFHYSIRYGIKDVCVHETKDACAYEEPAVIIDAYPAFPELVKICVQYTLIDLKIILRRIVRKMKGHNQSNRHR